MIFFCMGIILAVFVTDLIIKNRMEKSKNLPREACKGRVLLQRYHNYGMALNFAEGKQKFVAAVSLALTFFVFGMLIAGFGKKGNALLKVSLSVLLGGAFSNTYDRLKRGYVVDYVSFPTKWRWFSGIVFNISDFCIMAGALFACLTGRITR